MLMLSATPIHNHRADLESLFGIFLGSRAISMPAEMLESIVVRRTTSGDSGDWNMPAVADTTWVGIPADDALPARLLTIPPAVPPSDGCAAPGLDTFGLVRQWASSDAALRAAIVRRIARAEALRDALGSGTRPTKAELRTWLVADSAIQLGFAELLVAPSAQETAGDLAMFHAALTEHVVALRDVLVALPRQSARDAARASVLRNLLLERGENGIVAFTQFTETVHALFRELRRDAGVCALIASGGHVAGGRLSRTECLLRFAPRAHGVDPPPEHERIRLLITTDLLSEGISLCDAATVVHLDMPWTPARLEQRVGRLARPGSPHRVVEVFAISPPASAETVLRIDERLREKQREAATVLGVPAATSTLSLRGATVNESPVEAHERLRAVIRSWVDSDFTDDDHDPAVASVRAAHQGWLALLQRDETAMLLASRRNALPTADASVVRQVAAMATGDDRDVDEDTVAAVVKAVSEWCRSRDARDSLELGGAPAASGRRRALARLDSIVARTPTHARPVAALDLTGVRRAILASAGAGAEAELAGLAALDVPDSEWLRQMKRFGEASRSLRESPSHSTWRLTALLLLQQ